jgi:hypothetical protein
MEESISLEETNKIRISLGLKPLTDDSAPADDKEKQAETNYAKQREAEAKQRETKYVCIPSQAESWADHLPLCTSRQIQDRISK